VKKAHEVTFERWTWLTPRSIAVDIAHRPLRCGFLDKARRDTKYSRHKLRITIRVELVEDSKP